MILFPIAQVEQLVERTYLQPKAVDGDATREREGARFLLPAPAKPGLRSTMRRYDLGVMAATTSWLLISVKLSPCCTRGSC